MNTDLLNKTFPVSETPGLETFDSRLDDITTLAQDGNFDELAPQVAAVLEEDICDIRVIGYYGYLVFLEESFAGLVKVFRGMAELLLDNWEAVGPLNNRPKIAQNSLNWLFRWLLKKLQAEETSKGPTWQQWTESVSSDEVEEVLQAGDKLRRAAMSALEEQAGPIIDNLSKVIDWLRAFQRVVYREPASEDEPEGAEEGEEEEEEAAPAVQASAARQRPSADDGAISVEGSYHLQLLIRKMEAFERLIQEEKMPGAALIADDINAIIGSFNPLVYFPKLFAGYMRLLALHSKDLNQYDEMKESKDWEALKAFYTVDLDGFLDEC